MVLKAELNRGLVEPWSEGCKVLGMIEEGGWMIEIFSSGVGPRHRRYLVAIPNRRKAVAALHVQLGTQIDVSAATRVTPRDLEISGVAPGKILAV